MKYGSANALQPQVDTKTGQTPGPGCMAWGTAPPRPATAAATTGWSVATLAAGGSLGAATLNRFNAVDANGIQATMVVLILIILEDFVEMNGKKTGDAYQYAAGEPYLLAYLWVDVEQTFKNQLAGNYSCASGPLGDVLPGSLVMVVELTE
jgi:hypothetical protein